MIAAGNYYTATVLLALIHQSFSAMVLPRPPSSLNNIQRFDRKVNDQKLYEGKPLQSFLQNSNMEGANSNDYSLVEIELQSPDEMNATSLQNIVHTVISQSEQVRDDSYPNPEVVPHSVFGVRDIGLTPNFKMNAINDERHVLISPPKFQNHDEKLYYLKNNRPKVYVNVRGHSGTFRKDLTSKTSIEFLRPSSQRQTDLKAQHSKKIDQLKKLERQIGKGHEHQNRLSRNGTKKLNRLAIVYNLDDVSTTESFVVTSSELPKQIPAPPSKFSSRNLMTQTTPVQRYALRRTNVLPSYNFPNI